ncbi:MAG: sulfatase [Lentisphaeria bacterium]
MQNSPNIVLMVADDLGSEGMGCYGNDVINTPNLDALADNGVRFTNSFCTTASCAASRSVILTGKHNHANGTYGHTHGNHHFAAFSDTVSLPFLLNQKGYRTGQIGKKHFAPDSVYPFQWTCGDTHFGRDDVRMSEACREFIQGEEPFFLYWCSYNPHRAGIVEDHPLRPNSFGNPTSSFPGDKEQVYSEDEVEIPRFLSDTPEVRAELAQYYQSVSRLDRGVGHLMDVLKDEGKLENTIVMFISDNGIAFPEAKTTLYDPGMKLPCLVRSPLHKNQGMDCDGLITWADITPTILDWADVDADEYDFHGNSFDRIIDEESPQNWRQEIYAAHSFHGITNYYPMRVVRTKQYKFIYNIAWKLDYSFASDLWASPAWQAVLRDEAKYFGPRSVEAYVHRPCFELYDLENDPDEINNLAADPKYAEMVDDFKEKLKIFQADTNDPWLHKWEYE